MTHIRTIARRAAVATLRAAETRSGDRVHDSRADSFDDGDLPALSVYTLDDVAVGRELGAIGAQRRSLALTVEAAIVNLEDADIEVKTAELDDFCEEVEAAFEDDPTLGGAVANVEFEAVTIGPSKEGSTPLLLATITFRVEAWSKGAQLASGRLAVVTADGVAVGRLRSWSISENGEPVETTSAASAWGVFKNNFVGRWTATMDMTLDDDDEGQALLALKASRAFVFYPRGTASGQPSYAGAAIVAAVESAVSEDGDVIRTVTVTGNGSIGE